MIASVVIVTRLRLVRELLSSVVGSRPGLAVVTTSESESDAAAAITHTRPDIALIDAGLLGAAAVAEVARRAGARVVIFGVPASAARACPDVPCDLALAWTATCREMIDAVEDGDARGTTLPPEGASPPAVASLTARELEVLELVADGLSNKEIAARLTVSLPTVKSHVHNVLGKVGARRRRDAGRLLRRGVPAPSPGPSALSPPLRPAAAPPARARAARRARAAPPPTPR